MIYRGAREWTEYFRWMGYLCAAMAVGLLVSIPWISDRIPIPAIAGSSAALGALTVLARLMLHQLKRESVEMTEVGIRRGGSPLVPWGRVAALRERPWLQRIDLLDHAGTVLLRLPYEIESFSDAVERVVDHTGVEPVPGPFVASRRSPWVMGSVVLALLGVALWLFLGDVASLFIILLAGLGPLSEWAEGPPTLVSVTPEFVVVHRWRGKARYRTAAVTDLSFDRRTLDVVLSVGEGLNVGIRPRGVDPFGMFLTVRAAVERAAA